MTRSTDPSTSTVKTLIAIAHGMCEFRGCANNLVVDRKFLGEVAHIAAAQDGGPRYDGNLSAAQIKSIENLILLCPCHHAAIDKNSEVYSTEYLLKMKKEHEKKSSDGSWRATTHEINRMVWENKFAKFSQGAISSIPGTINGGAIPRDNQVNALYERLCQSDRIVVVGDKGSGKSVLLAQLCQRLMDKNKNVLLMQCDNYLGIESLDELKSIFDSDESILNVIDEAYTKSNPLIVICDSLDAISRNRKSMSLFKTFLRLLWGTNKVKTVCSVRSYDYEYSNTINQTDWGEQYDLELLTRQELNETLIQLGGPNVSERLKRILANPLNLKLLSLILARSPNADFANIKNEIELYDKHWKEYVSKSNLDLDIRSTLYNAARRMSSLQKIAIPYDEFNHPSAMHQTLSGGIILRDDLNDTIRFFHHAYLDYVVSRFILEEHSEFVDYLQEDEYNVFLRPTIVFALSVLDKRDPKMAIKAIGKILNSQLKYFWKISALTALAKIEEDSDQDFTNLGKFLTANTVLQRHFLMEITKQKNNFWFNLWKNSFFVEWSLANNGNNWFVVNYLKSTVPFTANHQHIFKLLRLLVANSNHSGLKRETVQLSSEIYAEGKAEWLLELSSNDDAGIRQGIVESLPKLIETDPEIVPDVFCNLFTYVETSTEKTQLHTYGTLSLTSTKAQDNSMILWRIGELFDGMLRKDPVRMVTSAIIVFEVLRSEELKCRDEVVEDCGWIWFEQSSSSRDENRLLRCIIEYLKECSDQKMIELMPILKSTRLAIIHSILIEALVRRKKSFKDKIFQLISNPRVYEILTLRKHVRTAIREICPLLKQDQIEKLLDLVMNIESTNREIDEKSIGRILKTKADFLSEFPKDTLQSQHRRILDAFPKTDLKYEPSSRSRKISKSSEGITNTKSNPEDVIASHIGKELEPRQKIELLKAIFEYLDKETHELDKSKFQSIKKFLIQNKDDPDPRNDAEGDDDSLMISYPTIRGLVAKCLIQLLYHSNDDTLVPIVKELSDDPIDTVRGEVCYCLKYLFDYDYDLAYSITLQYSKDPATRVQFFLRGVLGFMVHKNPAHATLTIINILDTLSTNDKKIEGIGTFLIDLALRKKEESAMNLLDRIIDYKLFSPEVRSSIPFRLKEEYLFKDEFQDQSLDLLYRLLDDPDHSVREKAAFFTLRSFEKDEATSNEKFVEKIAKHLDRIASEADKQPLDPRLIESLVDFLKKFWYVLPEKTIDYLEKIVNEKIVEYSTYQPILAKTSVKILAGIFQHPSLSKENQQRCLDILDKYAVVGWPEALQLLSAMERPD